MDPIIQTQEGNFRIQKLGSLGRKTQGKISSPSLSSLAPPPDETSSILCQKK
jgi:hypothetical protein